MNNALVNEASKQHCKSLKLLKKARHRIEKRILSKSRVIIALENIFSYCRNCCDIDEIETDNGGIMICSKNFEVYFKINDLTECTFDEENLIFEFTTNDERLYMEFL